MWELQLHLIEFLSKISNLKIFCPIIIILFITKNIKNFKFFNYSLIVAYSFLFLLSFSFKEYGIDSIRLTILRTKLSPVAYMSYKQDLELMKSLRAKRWLSFSIYQNIERLNNEFEYILDYLEKEKDNKPKILKNKKEHINMI